jgi:tyrosyl-tRNA synthetase
VVEFNSRWLIPLGSDGLIKLAAKYNVAQMFERREFRQRYDNGQPIAVHEFLYPLVQAYDSVALRADVELGGTDQLFNLNVGRDIMPDDGLAPQIVLTMPLLEGLDGVEKMSKSLNNYGGVDEAPASVFGKLMSISDDLMWRYYLLCTDVSPSGIEDMKRLVRDKTLHPKRAKQGLAMRIITYFHGEQAAKAALRIRARLHRGRPARRRWSFVRPRWKEKRSCRSCSSSVASRSPTARRCAHRAGGVYLTARRPRPVRATSTRAGAFSSRSEPALREGDVIAARTSRRPPRRGAAERLPGKVEGAVLRLPVEPQSQHDPLRRPGRTSRPHARLAPWRRRSAGTPSDFASSKSHTS